jgi:hypothetical protein
LVKPTLKSGPRVFIQNLFCNFLTFLQVSMNFGSLHYFLGIKSIEERFKTTAQCRAESGLWLQCTARRPATRSRPKGWLGRGLLARSNRGGSPRAARLHARRAHWRRGHRAQPVHDDALIIGPVVASHWQGVAGELVGTTERTLGKVGVGRAHRGGGATMGRRGSSVRRRVVGSSPKGESAATTTSSWSCGGG